MTDRLPPGEAIMGIIQETRVGICSWEERQCAALVDSADKDGISFEEMVQGFVLDNPELILQGETEDIKKELGNRAGEWVSEDWLETSALWDLNHVIHNEYRKEQDNKIRELAGDNPIRVKSLGRQAGAIQRSEDILGVERNTRGYGMAKGKLHFVLLGDMDLMLVSPKCFWFINALGENHEPLVELEVVEADMS